MIDANGDKSLQASPKRPRGNPQKVFVVHGRDLATRDAVFEFLDRSGYSRSNGPRRCDRPGKVRRPSKKRLSPAWTSHR